MSIATVTTRIDFRKDKTQRAADDWYIEPPEAVEALLRVEPFSGSILDPACGQGTIPKACVSHGCHLVMSSDLVDRGYSDMGAIADFLVHNDWVADNIITNPPFRLLEPFVERAMEVVGHKAAFLVRLAALEGMKRHERIFLRHPLARIHVFKNRVSMPPGGQGIEAKGGAVAFCWWVFDKSHQGPPTVHWIESRKQDTGEHLSRAR